MHIIQNKVKKCFGERIIVDKKMKEHRWRFRKYNIIFDNKQLSNEDESVKKICNYDFETVRHTIKELKKNNNLMVELQDINIEINEQKAFLKYLKRISCD